LQEFPATPSGVSSTACLSATSCAPAGRPSWSERSSTASASPTGWPAQRNYVQDRDEGEGWVASSALRVPAASTALVCAQCGIEAPPDAKGWQSHLGYDPRAKTSGPRRSCSARRARSGSSERASRRRRRGLRRRSSTSILPAWCSVTRRRRSRHGCSGYKIRVQTRRKPLS